jgi:hypothetical protein
LTLDVNTVQGMIFVLTDIRKESHKYDNKDHLYVFSNENVLGPKV